MENISCEGLIIKSTGGLYTVEKSDGTSEECRAKGAFRHSKITPLAGDRVIFEHADDKEGFITEIKPRKNSLIRPAVANVDLLCVVIAAKNPEPDLFILDKLCAVAKNNGIEVLLVVNKSDLSDGSEIIDIYKKAGFKCFSMCAANADGYENNVEAVRREISGKICFFTGASGVGKSSLLNVLYPALCLETGEISRKIARGKHTTRVTTLFKVEDNTYVGDTPGFSSFDVVGFSMLDMESLLQSFPDIEKYALDCKYKKCTHVCEDGCNVMRALDDGKISPSRHESYKALYDELKDIKPWS